MMFGHEVAAKEEVIGGMAGHFTRTPSVPCAMQSQINAMDAAIANATCKTISEAIMEDAIMEDLESIQGSIKC